MPAFKNSKTGQQVALSFFSADKLKMEERPVARLARASETKRREANKKNISRGID